MRCEICDEDTDLVEFDDKFNMTVICKTCRTEVRSVNDDMDLNNMRYDDWASTTRSREDE